jgi:hypothetical protein
MRRATHFRPSSHKALPFAINEYGWEIDAFPNALAHAERLGYACLGGQFQFVLQDATCEMYWLSADSSERANDEA